MPSAYAHYRFGDEMLKRLPEQLRRRIEPHRALYDIGVHGPDILFYFHPLKKTAIRKSGGDMHNRPGREFFKRAAQVIRPLQGVDRARALAYVYGFITHFSLDSACHTYVEKRVRETGVTHTEIEVEFDRRLMAMDGCPERCPVEHIVANDVCADTIWPFYEGVEKKHILHTLKSMRVYGHLLDTRMKWLQWVIRKVTGAIDKSGELPGWLATGHNPACDETVQGLLEKWQTGVARAEMLMQEFYDVLNENAPLNDAYEATFGAEEEKQ